LKRDQRLGLSAIARRYVATAAVERHGAATEQDGLSTPDVETNERWPAAAAGSDAANNTAMTAKAADPERQSECGMTVSLGA
jgi:hypothetical protein